MHLQLIEKLAMKTNKTKEELLNMWNRAERVAMQNCPDKELKELYPYITKIFKNMVSM